MSDHASIAARNFVGRIDETARRFPERTAVVWDGGRLTYAELMGRVRGFARFLSIQGVKAGGRVALAIDNRWPFPVACLAGMWVGATVVPLDPRLTADERRAILDDLGPAVVAHEVLGDEAEWPLCEEPAAAALILYTSGSTGQPKGAVLGHGALAAAIASWVGPVMALTPDDVVLAVLPLSHSFGLNGALFAPLLAGATVVLVERFTAEAAVAAIRAHGVTVFPGVATMFRRILETGELAGLERLRIALSGAAPCPWELAREWRERTGVRILRGYGMTELFRPLSYLAGDPTDLPDAVGRPVPGVEIRVVDDAGRAVVPGDVGELFIRTPAAMDGYLNAPAETTAVLADGWFRTGDLASVTPEGYVRIAGRKRERILRGGYSVFPGEVEAALLAHPAVLEAAVVGQPHAELGEEIVAFVVLRPGAVAAEDALIAHCRERLAAYKYPRTVVLRDGLPKTATGKIAKARLTR